jgi:hypothetical protein
MAVGWGIQILIFFVFMTIGTFWPLFVMVHIVVLSPGILMHPSVFPYAEPYILKFAQAIKCPYCQTK